MSSASQRLLMDLPIEGLAGAFVAVLILIPALRWIAWRTGRFAGTIPPVGGIAFLFSSVLAYCATPYSLPSGLPAGAGCVFLVGLLDDWSARSARGKTLLLIGVLGVYVWLSPVSSVSPILRVLWLLWMCNAFNVLDAVDGLSGGVGAIALLTLSLFASSVGLEGLANASALLVASLVAYLLYNFHPARVYMGDAGSLVIGFLLGETSLLVATTVTGFTGATTGLLPVSLVCFEGIFLILIRIAKVTMPTVSTHDHPTQRLIAAGISIWSAVLWMYFGCAALCVAAWVGFVSGHDFSLLLMVLSIGVFFVVGMRLGRVDTAGDGLDARPGTVLSKNWLVNRLVHRCMLDVSEKASGTLVDLGCGSRPYEAIFRERVDRYVGLDLNPTRYVSGSIDAVSDLEQLPIKSGSVDTVLSNQVIEHLTEPQEALREMSRVLRPGGRVIVTAPHIWGIHEEPHDYYRFTPYGLRHLAERSGLVAEEVRALAGYWVTTGARFCYYLERFHRGPLRPFVAFLYYVVQSTAFVLDHLHRVEGDAWNHVMVAVKPPDPG